MRQLFTLVSAILFSFITYAGNGAGTMGLVNNQNLSKANLILAIQLKKVGEEIRFATAKFENGQWVINNAQIESSLLSPEMKEALIKSVTDKNWTIVK